MPQLTVSVRDTKGTLGGPDLNRRLKALVDADAAAQQMAARVATARTRATFNYRREPIAPRAGRSSTGGQMRQHLRWVVRNGRVEFDMAEADARAPHWIIQEIGTGKRATIKQGGQANPVGRPAKGSTHTVSVRSQIGRRLSGGLVFATPGGAYTAPGAGQGQAIYWASRVKGVPQWSGRRGARDQAAAIRIRNEIPAKHMVRDGGRTGFRQYRSSVLAAARRAFDYGTP